MSVGLLDAGFDVSPVATAASERKPDFKINCNGEEMHVEVQAKQHDEAMAAELETFHRPVRSVTYVSGRSSFTPKDLRISRGSKRQH